MTHTPNVLTTTCPLDCPDACSLDITVEGDDIVAVQGSRDHALTAGIVCSKVGNSGKRQRHPDRILQPLRRIGPKGQGEFRPTTWDDALDHIVERFTAIKDQWGGEAILPFHYGGSNGYLTEDFLDKLLFARLGASQLQKTICAAPTTGAATGLYGKMPGVAFEDYVHARCIVLWGVNPKASSIHLVPFLREAKKEGAFVVHIDPRRNYSSKDVDLHLPIRPGTDLVLALGLIRWWQLRGELDQSFIDTHTVDADVLLAAAEPWTLGRTAEETGIATDVIEQLGDRLANVRPSVIRCGWGIERNRNGGQAAAAILAIPALLGHFGVRGGGYTMSNSGAVRFNRDAMLGNVPWNTRAINMTTLADALHTADPPIHGLFVYNANPVATVPDQRRLCDGLSREDLFTVVFDQVMTDSTAFADVVLPATTFFEHHDVRASYGRYIVGGVKPVVKPVGEARPNAWVFGELGKRFGFTDAAFTWTPEQQVNAVANAVTTTSGAVSAEVLLEGEPVEYMTNGGLPIPFVNSFPLTPDKKVHLAPPQLGTRPYHYLSLESNYPLTLISPGSARLITSTFGETNLPVLRVTLHPDDASARGIVTGDGVRVFNERGEVLCEAVVRDSVRPGVVSMPKGAWRKSSGNGWTSTALCPSTISDVGGGACFNDARVDIAKA